MHQLDIIGAFLHAKGKNSVFVKLDSRYADYFPEYSSYFGRSLRWLKYMYGMNKYVNCFAGELIEWFLESGFIQHQFHMSLYYKYAP